MAWTISFRGKRRRAQARRAEPDLSCSFYVPSMSGPGIRRESLETPEGRATAARLAQQLFDDAAEIARRPH